MKKLLFFLFPLSITLLIFWQSIIKNLYPFPGDFMLAWFEPWKTSYASNNTITIPHKPIADDVFRQILPFKLLTANIFKEFQFPLWNPYNGAGMPLMATMHIGFLTPFNLLFILLSPPLAWSLYIIIQVFFLSLFTYLYCQKIFKTIKASLFSSIIFSFSGFIIIRLIFGEYVYAISSLPLILYIEECFLDKRSKIILFLPLVISFLFVSGQPQIIFYIFTFCLIYFFYRFFLKYKNGLNYKELGLFLALIAVGIGLAAVQLFPTFELFENASISTSTSKFIFEKFLIPPQHLISILIPNYFGNQATYNYWGAGDFIETISAIGIIPSFFAFIAIILKNTRKDLKIFYLFFTIISILLAVNSPLTRTLFSIPIPIISTGAPSRIFLITTFCLSIMAGIGMDNLSLIKKNERKTLIFSLIFTMSILTISFTTFYLYKINFPCNNKFITDCRIISLRNTILELIPFLSFYFIFLFANIIKTRINKVYFFIPIVFVLILGIYNSNKFLPFSKQFIPKNELIKQLQKLTKDSSRVFGFGEANIKTDFATLYNFYDPNFYDPLYIRRYGELINFANTGSLSGKLLRSDVEISKDINIKPDNKRRDRLFNLLSVKYFVYKKSEINNIPKNLVWENKEWIITKNPFALPKAYIVSNYTIIENNDILTKLFNPAFNINKSVIMEENPNINKSSNINYSISVKKYKENEIILKTISSGKGILILTDNYYPGWKAFVDDVETKILRANYSFRSIIIPGGEHLIKLNYFPSSLITGIFISTASLIIYLFVIIIFLKFNKFFKS